MATSAAASCFARCPGSWVRAADEPTSALAASILIAAWVMSAW